MTYEKALKILTECVRIAAEHFPAMAEEYWAALRENEKLIKSINILLTEMKKRNMTEDHLMEYMIFEDELISKDFTFNSLIEAREKQIPYEPEPYKNWEGQCKCGVVFLDRATNYCGNCGQRLNWVPYPEPPKEDAN